MKKAILPIGLYFFLFLVGVQCGGTATTEVARETVVVEKQVVVTETPEPAGPVELTIVVGAEPASLHPAQVTDTGSEAIMLNMYEPLVFMTETGEVEPLLAKEWDIIDDRTYRFTLRDGVTFHSGRTFTADDVVATLNELVNPSEGEGYRSAIYADNIAEVVKEDNLTVTIKTETPSGPFLRNLAQLRIMPADMSRNQLTQEVNGTGPYELVDYVTGSHMVLARFDDYWGAEPQVSRVTFRIVPEASARVAEAQAGNADIVANVPPELVPVVAGIPEMKLIVSPTTYRITLTFNTETDTPVRNPEVRQAINYAIDRESIVKNILGGYGQTVGPLLPQDLGYDPSFEGYEYDPDRAKDLLAEAGYPDGFSVVLATPQGRYTKDKEVSEAVAGMLREVGIDARVQVYEWGAFLDTLVQGNLDPIYLVGWRGVNLDASSALQPWNCDIVYSSYCSKEMQASLEKGVTSVATDDRVAAYGQALQLFKEDPPNAYLFQETALYAVRDNIEWQPRVDQLVLVKTISVN